MAVTDCQGEGPGQAGSRAYEKQIGVSFKMRHPLQVFAFFPPQIHAKGGPLF